MAFGFSDLTPAGKRYFAELKKLAESEIQVGFQSDQTYDCLLYTSPSPRD